MIASINIVAKMFAKFAKTFDGLSTTIIPKRRRHVLIPHLEAKSAKTDYKNGIYAKNWVKSTWIAKSKWSKSTVNSDDIIASSDDVTRVDVVQLMMSADRVLARVGVWKHMAVCEEDWRHVMLPRIVAARGGAWKVRWIRYFHRKADQRDYFLMVQSVVWLEKRKWWRRQGSGLWYTGIAVEAVVLLTTTSVVDDTREDKIA